MKIIAWNLQNVVTDKLDKGFDPTFSAAQLGNNVLDYIINVVMSSPVAWGGVLTPDFPDVFMVVEVVSGQETKGDPATGSAPVTLARLTNAMNTVANAAFAPAANPAYQYAAVPALVVGGRETIGIIYIECSLNLTGSNILRKDDGNHYLPRDPFWAGFTTVASAAPLNVVGIHAPPRVGTGGNSYQAALRYVNSLTRSEPVRVAAAGTVVAGDFNCNPASTCTGVPRVFDLSGYHSTMATTRSTVKTAVQEGEYLSDAVDNVMLPVAHPPVGAYTTVPDLVGGAVKPTLSLEAVLDAYREVSDHLPVILEY